MSEVSITTTCPACGIPYTRDVYEEYIFSGLVLEMCDNCVRENSDEHGNFLIMLEKKYHIE